MAIRIINRNIFHLKSFIYKSEKSKCRCLHSSLKLDKTVQFCLSDIGEGIREVTVKSWHVKVEDKVAQFDNICEVESDKATVTITSRFDGVIKKLYYKVDDTAAVGNPLVDIDVHNDNDSDDKSINLSEVKQSDVEKTVPSVVVSREHNPVEHSFRSETQSGMTWDKSLATPAVRRIAMEHKVKLNEVTATGKNNRVLKEDILAYIDNLNKPKDIASRVSSTKCEVKPITRIMKTMIKTMTESNSIPTFGYSDNIDFGRLIDAKSRLLQLNDIKITFLPFILKAISKSLNKYPILNSSLDKDLKNIIYKNYHNIGIAVDSPSGLIVPNVKNVERLSILEISGEIKRLQKAAYNNTLTPSDLSDGTVSVSNIGAVGGIQGMPCILPPEVAIVAIGSVQKVPRFDEFNQVVPVHIANFTFSADHRIIDGATVSRLSDAIKNYLENPELLLIEL